MRLMLEVRDGSAAAFEELVVRYQARLVRVLEHLVGRRELAEDLTQEVFLRVYRSRQQYARGRDSSLGCLPSPRTWPLTRRATAGRRPEVTLAGSESGPFGARPLDRLVQASSGAMPARQVDKAELRDVVRMAMDSLSERQRLAVLLNKFEGMSYADIANTMELTPQAVKSLLSRARENLRQMLEPYLQNGTLPQNNHELSDSAVTSDGFVAGGEE